VYRSSKTFFALSACDKTIELRRLDYFACSHHRAWCHYFERRNNHCKCINIFQVDKRNRSRDAVKKPTSVIPTTCCSMCRSCWTYAPIHLSIIFFQTQMAI